eukprot:COSAG05_NODE_18362_length_309_cov_1.171429_1_plen_34_part_10
MRLLVRKKDGLDDAALLDSSDGEEEQPQAIAAAA